MGARLPRDGGRKGFTTTSWSLIAAAAETGNPARPEAIASLCQAYWNPVYAYLRRRGHDADQAQDLTQGFFSEILARKFFKDARHERGRFRSFLLTALKYYLSHERDRSAAAKRGGGKPDLRLDFSTAETQYRIEPAYAATPELIFEKRWAHTVLDAALARLREELNGSADPQRSLRLMSLLTGDPAGHSYRQVGAELGMNEGAVKVAVHRMRHRFGERLREEVAHTVCETRTVDEEIRYLFALIDS